MSSCIDKGSHNVDPTSSSFSSMDTMRHSSADLTDPSQDLEQSVGLLDPTSVDDDMDFSLTPPSEEVESSIFTSPPEEITSRIFTPPPHIAARFYRPSQNRRKDSAASSRRNSISSAHSRTSHGFGRDTPQSKYIAQQMRRASILEDRKARLADRAAHAEKVRLRAALAKAQPKTCNSEERALAAAQARRKNLDDIVAACAEEVKRAKAVAESTKEKREQNLLKMKSQMEERHAEAEKRREELRKTHTAKRSRGSSLNSKKPDMTSFPDAMEQDPQPMSSEVAASKIQWWWRAALRRKAVLEFAGLGLSIDAVRESSFQDVAALLSKERVLAVTSRVLRICGLEEGEAGSVNDMAAVRTFLSAFLILGHPTQVLSSKDSNEAQGQAASSQGQHIPRDDLGNPQSQDLVGKARDVLISFENILSRLSTWNSYTPPPVLLQALPESYALFHNAFIAWKARDSNALIEVMVMQFVELDAILESVKNRTEEAVAATYDASIRNNQVLLVARIKKLAGAEQGKKMIAEAVRQARKARATKKPAGDTKPRVSEHVDSSTATERAAENGPSQLQPLTPPATPKSKQSSSWNIVQPTYPPILPDNRIVVHELAINREYRMEFEQFQEQHKLRMDPFFQDLKFSDDEEKQFKYLISMANYIRDRLQHLVKPESPMHTFIGEMLDTDVAQQQFLAGSFSYEKFFASMGSLLPKLCAPVRDDLVKDLVENKLSQGHVVDRLEALVSFIDVMIYDFVNYMLQVAAPKLLEESSAYEARRFADDLETGAITLSRAEESWRNARNKVHAEANRRDPEGVGHPRSRPTADKIYWHMLLDEFTQPAAAAETAPEPLALDATRRTRLGTQTLRIATAGTILLQCKNLLKRDVRASWKAEAGRILIVLESLEDPGKPLDQAGAVDGILAALEAGRSMPAATKTHLRTLATKVVTANAEARRTNTEPQEPVLKLLLTRVRSHILARLQAGSTSEKVKTSSAAGEKLANLGMPEFVEKVREMVDELVKVGTVDREAHGAWWESISEKVEREASGAAS